MQKSEFLQKLTDLLKSSDMEQAAISDAVSTLSEYLDTLPPEALDKELNELSSVNRVAQVILSRQRSTASEAQTESILPPSKPKKSASVKKPSAKPTVKSPAKDAHTDVSKEKVPQASAPAEAQDPAEPALAAKAGKVEPQENAPIVDATRDAQPQSVPSDKTAPLPNLTSQVDAVRNEAESASESEQAPPPPPRPRKRIAQQTSGDTIKIDPISRTARSGEHRQPTAVQTAAIPAVHTTGTTVAVAPTDASRSVAPSLQTSNAIKYSDLDKLVTVSPLNRIIFWFIFLLLLPLILGLILIVAGAFLVLLLGLACVIAACIGILIGVVGAGTGISLFGLIYGTTQLFSTVSAGLYEIGLAITVAGGSLFVGIVLYNAAIRLIPFLMKHLYRFFFFVMKKGYQLFRFIRRECTGK